MLGLINMGGFSATFFVPSAVKTTFQLSAIESAYLISTSYIVAIFVNLLFGYLCDRFNRWDMMIALAVLLVPACFAMMAPESAGLPGSHSAGYFARAVRHQPDLRAGRRGCGEEGNGSCHGRCRTRRRRVRIRWTAGAGTVAGSDRWIHGGLVFRCGGSGRVADRNRFPAALCAVARGAGAEPFQKVTHFPAHFDAIPPARIHHVRDNRQYGNAGRFERPLDEEVSGGGWTGA